ncbi:MAG: PAS domain-containing sensor histidine kinase, partial [Aestuariivirgaceae bacterium]
QVRNIELARAIDNIAMVTATSAHVQQFLDSSVPGKADTSIRVIDKTSLKIVATNQPSEYRTSMTALQDRELRKVIQHALSYGSFHPRLVTRTGRDLTVLPLTSARHVLAGNFVLDQAKTLKPAWHRNLQPIPDTPATWLSRLFSDRSTNERTAFKLPHSRFAGVMVIETGQPWLSSLTSSVFFGSAMLICSGFIIIVLSGWYVCQRCVLRPINGFSEVLEKQRDGITDARAARSGVTEFDRFARQWNGLLNYRQAAEARTRVLSKVLEKSPIGFEVTTPQALIEYANPAYLRMTGHSLMDVIGKTPQQLLGSDNVDPAILKRGHDTVKKGQMWHSEFPSRRADGTEIINEVTLCPIMSEDGKLERIVAVRQDITERKKYERSLIEAKQASEAAERHKSEFIARMSHELRTPFNAIIGFADIIAKQQLGPIGNESYLEFATIIEQSAKGLLGIINSIIDLSRMAAGQRPLDDAPVNLQLLTRRIVRAQQDRAERDNISIEIHDNLAGYGLIADELMLEQLAENLVSNAVKFNRQNSRVDVILRRDRRNRIVLEIDDSGIGIARSDIHNARKPFVQLSPGYDREYEGIGLGLTLAENQAAAHGAELKIASHLEKGTKVSVIFPNERTIKPLVPRRKRTDRKNGTPAGKAA